MATKVEIEVVGISLNKNNSTPFIVILGEKDSDVRMPVIIGASEAQAIAVALEHISVPRPLTHDSFAAMARLYDIKLLEVFIYNYENGVFSSEMVFSKDDEIKRLDSRTSDAIAIALRMNSPIYTTKSIISEAKIIFNDDNVQDIEEKEKRPLKELTIDKLNLLLDESVKREDYETAAQIHAEIKQRKETQS
ncbi:MAG: DUF151 domain-containing protein [Bacteroidales bacterium]